MKMPAVVTAAVVVAALAAGCGSARAPQQSAAAPSTLAPSTAAGVTAAGNRKLSAEQASLLMSVAPVPAGAKALSKTPASVSMPGIGLPGNPAQVDISRSWQLTMTYNQAVAWLRAQRPRGLIAPSGPSWLTTAPATPVVTGYSYDDRSSSPAWQSAELNIEVASAARGTSVLRTDAVVTWLDPVPIRDNSVGQRVHVTVAAGCPATDRSIAGVTNSGADLGKRLLPSAAPTAGLECRFYGNNGRSFGLHSHTSLTAAAASQVAGTMLRLPLSHPDGGDTVSCPEDDGTIEIIALSYPGRPACRSVGPAERLRVRRQRPHQDPAPVR